MANLTSEQLENWRRVLSITLGAAASALPDGLISTIVDDINEHFAEEREKDERQSDDG